MTARFHRSLAARVRTGLAAATIASLLLAGGAPARPVVAGGARTSAAPATADPVSDLPTSTPAANSGPMTPSRDDGPATDSAGLQPSIQYADALAHQGDRIAFQPGGRVTVGFTPSSSDDWSVDGRAPAALPSGRLDGRTIRGQHTGPAAGSGEGVDQPNGATPLTPAKAASFEQPVAGGTEAGDGGTGTVTTQAAITPVGLRREIFGFLPYWEVSSRSLTIDDDRISTIAYFGIGTDGAGNLQKRNGDGSVTVGWSGWTSSRMTAIIDAAHRSHTRVVLTVQSFGWTSTSLARQKALLTSSTARANLARQIAAAVRDRGADGVNLDFEPLASGAENGFVALVRSIRSALNRIHTGYQITFDTLGSIGNYPIEAATARGAADALFVMGYDYRTSGSSPVGSIAPLDRTNGIDIRDTLASYVARVPASKVILGVPYYGRAWSTSSSGLNASNTSSAKTGASTSVTYDTAADYLAKYGHHYDPAEEVAWTAYRRQNCTSTYGCVTSWRQLYVDDTTAIAKKYDLVNAYGLRGAGIWALGYDGSRPELWNVIKAKFITDKTAPVVGVRRLPGAEPNPAFGVAWHGTDDSGIRSYDVQASVDGGPWLSWLTGTKATSAIFQGTDGHGYAFRVRARDIKGNVGAWNVTSTATTRPTLASGGFGRVLVDGLSVRAAAGTDASVVGTLSSGDVVAITGGPTSADGYTWVRVSGPLTEWRTVDPDFAGRWIPVSGGRVGAIAAPNSTVVDARIGGLGFDGAGTASLGVSASAAAHRIFSPNGDGSRDGVRISWTNAIALDSLVLRVFRSDGATLGDVAVNRLPAGAQTFTWNGVVGGRKLPDGQYLATLIGRAGSATYFNPVNVFRSSVLAAFGVRIDTVRPTLTAASVSGSLLSPNGDGRFDTVRFAAASTGGGTRWTLGIAPYTGSLSASTQVVLSGSGGSPSFSWNGTDGGSVVPDGIYVVRLTVFDAAGNPASKVWAMRVDRMKPTLTATAAAAFSPNGDGSADAARIGWRASEKVGGWVRVYHGTTLVRSWSIAGSSGTLIWDGRAANGSLAVDGHYTIRMAARDAAGNLSTTSRGLVLDRTLFAPHWSSAAFSPRSGSLPATDRFAFTLIRPATVTVAIYRGSTLVRTLWLNRSFAAGKRAGTWDGRTASGAAVAAGTYSLRVTATSSLATTVAVATVQVR